VVQSRLPSDPTVNLVPEAPPLVPFARGSRFGEFKKCRLPWTVCNAQVSLLGGAIVPEEIDAETVLENCCALIKQIKAGLSTEEPFVNASSAAQLLLHLEAAAAALKKSFEPSPPEH
jgi:hypothetical protein